MTLRPFKITYKTSNDDKVRYYIIDHRGQYLLKNSKLGKKFFDKLLSYPITAFGYDIFQMRAVVSKSMGDIELNPKFDRTDVIKALDFWIEHWVYHNKKDYILEGTVNKDFELTVRELIETREAVLKMPVDTEFVRKKISIDQGTKEKGLIEFTENVLQGGNTVASTVDQFCYIVRKMTYKEYMKQHTVMETKFTLRQPNSDIMGAALFERTGITTSEWFQSAVDSSISEFSRALGELGAGMNNDEIPMRLRGGQHTDNGNGDFSMTMPERPDTIDGFSFSADPDTSMTVPVVFTRDNTEITMNLFLTPTQQIRMFDSPLGTVHRIRITPGSQNPVEIDGQNYNVVDINISYDPRDRLPFVFRDLWVQSLEATQNILRVDFSDTVGLTRISLTLQVDRTMNNEFLNEGGRSWSLEILGNNMVRIGNNEFTVREPINITIR